METGMKWFSDSTRHPKTGIREDNSRRSNKKEGRFVSMIACYNILSTTNVKSVVAAISPRKKFLKLVDNFYEELDRLSTKVEQYNGPGYDIGAVLPLLDERDCSIGKSDYLDLAKLVTEQREITALVFNFSDRITLQKNSQAIEDIGEMEAENLYNELYATTDKDSGRRILEAIRQIVGLVSQLRENEIMLATIG